MLKSSGNHNLATGCRMGQDHCYLAEGGRDGTRDKWKQGVHMSSNVYFFYVKNTRRDTGQKIKIWSWGVI
jgi:hypothetical protein